jgi:hypothetical protein
LRDGIKIGNQYKREVAFSILDEEMGLGLVPTTVMRKHKGKIGSYQRWKEKYMSSYDMETYLYNKGITTGGGWKKLIKPRHAEGWYLIDSIGQNVDRHGGNYMAKPVHVTKRQKVYVKKEAKKEFEKAKNKVALHESDVRGHESSIKNDKVTLANHRKDAKAMEKELKKTTLTRDERDSIEFDLRYKIKMIDSKKAGIKIQEKVLKNSRSDLKTAKENRDLAEQKWQTAPSTKMMDVETIEIRIALIDNGLTLPTGHGPPSNGTPLTHFQGKKVSPHWMKKLRTMKNNEESIRIRMKQESGLSDIAIDVFFTRLDRVLDTGVHLDSWYSKGFKSDKHYNFGKGRKNIKGSA